MPAQIAISETVLRTTRYDLLCEFYSLVLNEPPAFDIVPESTGIKRSGSVDIPTHMAFFNLYADYPFTQRLGVFECLSDSESSASKPATGLHHFQLRVAGLEELFEAYARMKEGNHVPMRSYNHGSATSFYYDDPDGNVVEISCVNFPTIEETQTFMRSPAYQRNPSGSPIDPEAIIARAEGGEELSELVWAK